MRRVWWFAAGLLVGCSGSSSSGSFAERSKAARERAIEATCGCLLSKPLRDECLASRKGSPEECTAELAGELEERHAAYSKCIIDTLESDARCLEEANCRASTEGCKSDTRQACGDLPDDLKSGLLVCLPTFSCSTGQEVTLDRRCDGVDDCFDASDESRCR